MRVTVLGCGTSSGVPMIGCDCPVCRSSDPRNKRRRCSILLEAAGQKILFDTGPDIRQQCLDAGIDWLDAVVFTHAHADHTHGLDDLRPIVYNRRARLPVWADKPTADSLVERFGYAFIQPEWSSYPPILDLHHIDGRFEVDGPAGPVPFRPFTVHHGGIDALGFRIHDLAYLPDVSEMPETSWGALEGLDCWILDALRYTPHPTHVHLEKSLEWIDRMAPRCAVLTNMHIDLDYATLDAETPANVTPAHDGLTLRFPL